VVADGQGGLKGEVVDAEIRGVKVEGLVVGGIKGQVAGGKGGGELGLQIGGVVTGEGWDQVGGGG
jgi:hypothetical protein